MKREITLAAITFFGIAAAFGGGICFGEQDAGSSSSCINCHSDLEEMDSFGAAAAGGGGAIAG